MEIQKFSHQEFESRGLDTDQAQKLADELSVCVHKKLHKVAEKKFLEIIRKLNSEGHRLMLYENIFHEKSSCIAYRDDFEDDESYHCKLRVAIDLFVYSGYSHLISNEKMEEE
ncbi:hypothetical protein IQ249_24865 [Lusitaniella coriacea LEGE 07157]|uniref:Uncharacterized protein n=1 Tax=Lusitaniella coriacea LEGE 07157 TaxID=945747 RepID=A0A8J7E0W2_9CYAN|nr:hypothetical protein [Lusitaniella coriacea]MBE9119093.1 hypothetical protein [Lusitaniella coriacea LEGE 07157]